MIIRLIKKNLPKPGLDFRGRLEVVLSDLHEVVDPGQQLRVHRQPAVQLVAGLSHQSLGKLPLEQDH